MATFAADRTYQIFLGTPTVEVDSTVILGLGPTGDPNARRRLVHPDAGTFDPIVYFQNPVRTFNINNQILPHPLTNTLRTLDTTGVTRFEEFPRDVVITEVWPADANLFSIPGFFFRQLYEYLANPPAYSASAQEFIQWQPQDENEITYNIEILRLQVGSGGDPTQIFDVTEFHPYGQNDGGETDPLANLDDAFKNEGSGLLDRTVTFRFKIHSEV